MRSLLLTLLFFFFNDTATTEIYTLSLHDALPISLVDIAIAGPHLLQLFEGSHAGGSDRGPEVRMTRVRQFFLRDRKSTRLNSNHSQISYAVFCLQKKKKV